MNINKSIKFNFNVLFIVYVVAAFAISFHGYTLGEKEFEGVKTTHYNNYLTMKYSHFHLLDEENIYIAHPDDHWDLFKYSPAFAVLMGIFAYLPDLIGLIMWNLLNALALFFAIKSLPIGNKKIGIFMLWFIFIELLTNLMYEQSNGLMAGLMIYSFSFFEKGNKAMASLCLVMTVFIKIFGLALFPIFLFYPKKIRFLAYTVLWFAILIWLPLIFIPFEQFIFLHKEWYYLLTVDYEITYGLSLIGILNNFDLMFIPRQYMIIAGGLILMLPLIFIGRYSDKLFRYQFLASVMIWVIIFNYRAESPTYIIAIAGIAIWYFTSESGNVNTFLLLLALIFTSLSVSDLIPQYIRDEYFKQYQIKAIPCILIWLKLIFDLYFRRYKPAIGLQTGNI